jgi:hypothetical protein
MTSVSFIFFMIVGLLVAFLLVWVLWRRKRSGHLEKNGLPAASAEDKRARPVLHLSPAALLSIQSKLDFQIAAEWRQDNPIEQLPWQQILGEKYDKLIGLAGSGLSVDITLLSYVVLLGCAAEKDPKFFNCGVHKNIEKKFVQTENATIQLGAMNSELYGELGTGGGTKPASTDDSPLIASIQRIRTAAWHYADPKRPASSKEEQLARLLEATPLMKIMAENSECQSFVFGLAEKMVDYASAGIDLLILSRQDL